ncbi:MAG TPA: DUF5597 domain-containing protein [Terracidiphilus sp.]|nr:DUF5597 domain-containing protein [Terracidiphilus sp.]
MRKLALTATGLLLLISASSPQTVRDQAVPRLSRQHGATQIEIAGIDSIWKRQFVHGNWVAGRNLNGDDENQGLYLRMPSGQITIRSERLYTYR